ncbi:RNA--NAD 2'-phosphotransferase [Spartobacteria bacterium LR76]|nr:RNA--NAD 2'-phosphotransferase [Spartobacteria bacterium LR76]
MSKQDVRKSKFLSLVLRHEPERIGVKLDESGWIDVEALLAAMTAHGKPLSRAELDQLVRENDKQRFAFNSDGTRIRANQGHSVEVDLALEAQMPPEKLYHGTVEKFLASIFREGLLKGERHHVHLSPNLETDWKSSTAESSALLKSSTSFAARDVPRNSTTTKRFPKLG